MLCHMDGSAAMTVLRAFPVNGRFLMVKWIDGFLLPWGTTRSAAVTVFLQELPITRIEQLNRLTRRDIRQWLRSPPRSAGAERGAPDGPWTTSVTVLASDLPLLAIGDVYLDRRRVGSIPTTPLTIQMHADDRDITPILKTPTARPPGWGQDYPHYLLNPSEYDWVKNIFPGSRYLLIPHPTEPVDYILPRTEIFRRFYAAHSEMAKAFTLGPWSETLSRVIYDGPRMDSGLKTERCGDAYHLILQTKVPNPYARMLAMFYFDDYARECAKTVFSAAMADTGVSLQGGPAYCAARIPLRASLAEPLTMRVRGWYLGDPDRAIGNGRRAKFLITNLLTCSEPPYVPLIKYERFNSGSAGKTTSTVDERAPFSNQTVPHEASTNLEVTEQNDANAKVSEALIKADHFFLTDGKPLVKLPKESSKSYAGPGPHPADDSIPDVASSGETTGDAELPAPATIETLMRRTVDRFWHLRQSFSELVDLGVLMDFEVESPHLQWQLIRCGGEDCWCFLTEEQRVTPDWPRMGWVMIERAQGHGANSRPGVPRSALIMRLVGTKQLAYWIEIESRPNEKFTSALLVGVAGDVQEALRSAIAVIPDERGVLRHVLPQALAGQVEAVHIIEHDYRTDTDEAAVTTSSLIKELVRANVSDAPGMVVA